MYNDTSEDGNKYSKFYSEFIDSINNKNNPKHKLALQHVNDVAVKMYSRNTIIGKNKQINKFGSLNVSNINFIALPIPYPKFQFERCKLTSVSILKLIDYLSQDNEFITLNFSTLTDKFVSNLYKIYTKSYMNKKLKVRCYLNRSDFMIDGSTYGTNGMYCSKCIADPCICNENDTCWPKLIETNCIAVSNTTHSTSLNRILHPFADQQDDITASVAKFINMAIELNKSEINPNIKSSVLVVYDSLDTIFDWGRVGTILEDEYKHMVFYHTLSELVQMYEAGQFVYDNGELIISKFEAKYTIKFIYLRSCYIPQHINGDLEWKIIEYLEVSNAVKVPTIATQLVCSKFGQMLWSTSQIINNLPHDIFDSILYTRVDQCDPAIDDNMRNEAIKNPDKFVLKNHLEGGHGIFFNKDISDILGNISPKEYVLSRRIFPPLQKAVFVNTNEGKINCRVYNSVNELGIYSFGIFTQQYNAQYSDNNPIIETPGYLSRTKPPEITGGGICSGISNLSAIKII